MGFSSGSVPRKKSCMASCQFSPVGSLAGISGAGGQLSWPFGAVPQAVKLSKQASSSSFRFFVTLRPQSVLRGVLTVDQLLLDKGLMQRLLLPFCPLDFSTLIVGYIQAYNQSGCDSKVCVAHSSILHGDPGLLIRPQGLQSLHEPGVGLT